MELGEDIALYLAVVMGSSYNSFQVHTRQPNGRTCKSSVIAEVNGKLLDEVGCQFLHGYVAASVAYLQEVRYIVP